MLKCVLQVGGAEPAFLCMKQSEASGAVSRQAVRKVSKRIKPTLNKTCLL